jgi:cytochrome c-type biogenesis protein CcmH/NrfG
MAPTREATTTGRSTDGTEARVALLARLGLDATADDEQVESTYDRIADYLDEAPADIRGWAEPRQREADRIFDLLTGPEAALAAAAQPAVAAEPPVPQGTPGTGTPTNKLLLGVIAVLVTVGVVLGVYWMGRPTVPDVTSAAAATPTATAPPAVDQAQLAALTTKVKADPKDVASLQKIADLYFTANDWTNAKASAEKVLAVDPKNEQALVSLGAASYNGGDMAGAEKAWKKGVALFPKNAELHYDLGFLYMTTGRSEQMRTEWAKVVEIAPDSELAKTVQSQVGAVSTPSPSPAK